MKQDLQQSIKELSERSQELLSHVEGIMSRIEMDVKELTDIAEKLKDLPDLAKSSFSNIDFSDITKSVEKFQDIMAIIKPDGLSAMAQRLAGRTK